MTTAAMIRAWLLGPLALLAALLLAAQLTPAPPARFHGAAVAVIGSSLSAYALPESGQNIAPSSGKHWRIGIALPAEPQLLELLESAVAERPRLILLEANPFVTRFALDPRRGTCASPAGKLRQAAKRTQVRSVDGLRRLFGARSSLEGMGEPAGLDRPQTIDQALLKASYPLAIRPPCDEPRLLAAVRRAQAEGTRVVLIAPPRSPTGERWLGPVQSQAASAEMREMAARLGVPLFEPAGPWLDAGFNDHAHLNAQGRAQFVAALRTWLEQSQ
jgi:hypothetical protein